jgi:hypothetical protein
MTTTHASRSLQGRYRPAVKAAWLSHVASIGADPDDRAAYDSWYRDILRDHAGISTTSGATAAQMESLISAFLELAHPHPSNPSVPTVPRIALLTPAQQTVFADLVLKAWKHVVAHSPTTDFNAWFIARMAESQFPVFGNSNVFDCAMCIFAVIANDTFWLSRTAEAQERRLRHVIRAKLADLSAIRQTTLDWSYVQGICSQAALASSIDDCPADHLRLILAMISTQIRREASAHLAMS